MQCTAGFARVLCPQIDVQQRSGQRSAQKAPAASKGKGGGKGKGKGEQWKGNGQGQGRLAGRPGLTDGACSSRAGLALRGR